MQIRTAAANGTDVGLLTLPKSGAVPKDVMPTWVNLQPAAGARVGSLKTVKYGNTDTLLMEWTELTGSAFRPAATFFAAVVDRTVVSVSRSGCSSRRKASRMATSCGRTARTI
jgi:hypothetical protein